MTTRRPQGKHPILNKSEEDKRFENKRTLFDKLYFYLVRRNMRKMMLELEQEETE